MKIGWKGIATLAVLCLALSGAAFASQGKAASSTAKTTTAKSPAVPAKTATKTMSASGTVVSSSANSLVISHKVKGKDEQMTFSMDSATQKERTITDGANVSVKYHSENGTNMATWV